MIEKPHTIKQNKINSYERIDDNTDIMNITGIKIQNHFKDVNINNKILCDFKKC